MIKALFFDLDGTLLNCKSQISDHTRHALCRCREKGIQCYIATGRPKTLDKMISGWTKETFSLFDGGVFCNGACIWINDCIEYHFIDSNAVKMCIDIVNSYPEIHLVLQMKDEVHAFNYEFNEEHIDEWGLQDRRIVPLDDECLDKTVKIMIYTKNLVDRTEKLPVELFEKLQNKLHDCAQLYLIDQGEVILIVPESISKYTGIEEIRKIIDCSKEEIAVFGDDANDKEMLSLYPHSCAMQNASDEIKSIASFVTCSNDEDGVAYALKHRFKVI